MLARQTLSLFTFLDRHYNKGQNIGMQSLSLFTILVRYYVYLFSPLDNKTQHSAFVWMYYFVFYYEEHQIEC